MANQQMIYPSFSDLAETLHIESTLLVYDNLQVTAQSVQYLLRN